ncbi:MAG: nucleotidyl transferase AbiEii/AbiGii toxin family protein [Deltaproteobacteria bacterium]|nr:nucleotidyl transferase AbiEii/AbiGii toxin family protein [Deltaproteobacteria bacterium]
MNRDTIFFKQADLMLRMIPFVATERCFALKGGTAINFFVRNMPRLSVDIDLTYLPLEDRNTALENISAALTRIAVVIRKAHKMIKIQESHAAGSKRVVKLVVRILP